MIFTAFILGLTGSLHCIGMCGPIALAMPRGKAQVGKVPLGPIWYNLGRIMGYGLLGMAAGMFGEALSFMGLQQGISIGLGIGLLLFLLLGGENKMWQIPGLKKALVRLKMKLSAYLTQKGSPAYLHIGLLNSLLPCGFVYLALAGGMSLGSVWESTAYLIVFGLGTIPAMLGISLGYHFLPAPLIGKLRPWLNTVGYLLAFLLIIRGLGLGIPWLSPVIESGVVECH